MKHETVSQSKLSHEQKTGFVLLLLFTLLTLGLTFVQLRNTIYNPYAIHVSEASAPDLSAFDETTRLQQIDTDHDGLSDYEELYFYETSPYIPDTDSDGIDDATELKNGTDPLCPKGKDCKTFDTLAGASSTLQTSIGVTIATPNDIVGQFDPSQVVPNSPENSTNVDPNQLLKDPTALRELLLSTGQITKEALDNITDEQLLSMAAQTAASSTVSTSQ